MAIKLLLGGSPCTHWSIAQQNNRETTAEGLGWELFKNYLIAKEKFKPDFFLYENNKSAAQAIKDQIAYELGVGVDPKARFTYINSALVSAQNRQRFYVTNFGDIKQPADRGILLKDILETGESWTDKSYCLITAYGGAIPSNTIERKQRTMVAEPIRLCHFNKGGQGDRFYSIEGKSICLSANGGGGGAKTGLYAVPLNTTQDGKAKTMRASADKDGIRNMVGNDVDKRTCVAEPVIFQVPHGFNKGGIKYEKSPTLTANGSWESNNFVVERWGGKTYPVYEVKAGQITIKDKQYPIKLQDGFYIIRKLTVTECCRLQTLPDFYCKAVSASQGYKSLGNGWTAEVIIHLLNHALKDVPKDEEIVVLSMYDGIATGRYCLDKMGFTNVKYHAYEIDKYPIAVAMDNYPDIIQHGDAFTVREDDWEAPQTTKLTNKENVL
jgi:DNA (cytosine-5)-methyltransferase 3A